ncbi:precorrin-4/cobalt-precorrin-4 C11-methyltransferase [Methylopila capsulata]|uniref:Precorrin-4 C(11)-methyltransferase n=1 Tax=Methylopila capsulata TaxID=61654 RepID=A0A9W6IX24_9HYPH|nr:precorrin-4 C(11)-methyltransferase [Methylopila capsulata]MBM7853015.1 precorrin-4/cobalt-precorrin-4 C11-methyltransferase [Methylopila capsulata]GLK57773.1 precorrin-4 C(11)-methyltransferase [Methylopila capsulata]
MTVHFIGAGPGDPDLITVRGRDLIARCPVCLYAGSLVPKAVVAYAPEGARVRDTAGMALEEIVAEVEAAHAAGLDVARVHSGDPSLYGATAEQFAALAARGIPYEITPGVPAFAAAAARLGVELTVPEVAQTVVLSRLSGRASPMPPAETLANVAASRGTLALHLAAKQLPRIAAELTPLYGADCPVALVARATWPDEVIVRGTLADIVEKAAPYGVERTALVLVGWALGGAGDATSALYDAAHDRHLKPATE